MNFTDDYLEQSRSVIETIFKAKSSELIAASGNAETEFKDDKSVVTKFDQAMELELKKALQNLDANIGFEGEEFGIEGSRETFWLVDPIDGTESFIRGLETYRNMATLIDGGRPVFTIVYRPAKDEMFTAKQGKGAYKNGRRLHVSQRPLHRVRLECAIKYDKREIWPVVSAIENSIERARFTDEFLYVVEAKLDAHLVYETTKPWDTAPRMLLLKETGAVVANIGKQDYDYLNRDFLAASPEVFNELSKIIKDNLITL